MRSFTYVKKNIRRTPYQALAATMVMFFTFLTLLLFLMVAYFSQQVLTYYESKPQAIAFFKDNTTSSDIEAIENSLKQTGIVTNTKYVTKEEALAIYKDRNKDNPQLLELVTANILPASLEVSTITPKDLTLVAQMLKKEPVVEQVIVPEDVIASLTHATSVVRGLGVIIVGFLGLFAILVILMIIGFKIRIKRTEIETMRLLGASTWFIRAPFLLEGISYGIMGALSAWVVSIGIIWYLTPWVNNALLNIKVLPFSPQFLATLLITSLVSALLIGAIGSYGAVKRYLRLK